MNRIETETARTLNGKTALLTGAARRLGAETARTLHHYGATVVIHYRHSSNAAEQLCEQLNHKRPHSCFLVQADLLDIPRLEHLVTQTLQQVKRLDILVNNASTFYPTAIGEITEAHWDDLMGSNLKAPLFVSQAFVPALKETKGCIINIVDIHALRPLKGYPVYSAAKAGLLMLTQSLARELGPTIRVNGVAPGAILWPEQEENQAAHQELLQKTALKREGHPADIARTVLFLAKDADYITGQIIPVDGGRVLNH